MRTLARKSTGAAFLSVLLIAASLLIPSLGCATRPTSSTSRWKDPAFVESTAFYLKATVANGVVVALEEDKNAKSYVELVGAVVDKFVQSPNRSAKSLESALTGIPVKELKGKYAKLAVTNLALAYELYWSQIVRDSVEPQVAAVLLQAVSDGIRLGLSGSAPPVPDKPAAN